MKYPNPLRDDSVKEMMFGQLVIDPYRSLEDPDHKDTVTFVEEQNKITQEFLSKSTIKSKLKEKLTALTNYPKYGTPMKKGDYYYYFHNSGLLPQSVLYRQLKLNGEPSVFFDPNKLSADGTTSLSTYGFSESGKYFAYALSDSGSDWVKILVKSAVDLDSEPIDEPLMWAKFTGINWTHDDKGFFYNAYPEPDVAAEKAGTETTANKNSTIKYHRLGTPQSADIKFYTSVDNPDELFSVTISDDGQYLILTTSLSCEPTNKFYVCDLKTYFENLPGPPTFTKVVDNFDFQYSYIANDGTVFWIETTLDAPKSRVVKYDLAHPELGFVEVVPETKDVISFLDIADNDKLIIARLQDVKHVVSVHSLYTGQFLYELPLPLGSMIGGFSAKRSLDYLFYTFSSFLSPGTTYRFDFKSQTHTVHQETKVNGLQSEKLETKQVFYASNDGTKIPMYLIHKKGLKLDGNNSTLLYGYGGFNVSITPSFSVNFITFVQHFNGVVAIANLRGGGEYGQDWYNQGRLGKKQNVFDDFQSAAKYLIAEKYTNPKKLAINGGSNGGLLVGACTNQAPELFGCAIAEVGVLDMLRFHKFTIGHAWVSDYGNPEVKEDFEVLMKYSPLHNIKKQPYPAILVMTGDHDDRVVPAHSLKYLATLQYVAGDNLNPILGRIQTKAGHGAGKSTAQRIEEATDKFAFLALVLGSEWSE